MHPAGTAKPGFRAVMQACKFSSFASLAAYGLVNSWTMLGSSMYVDVLIELTSHFYILHHRPRKSILCKSC